MYDFQRELSGLEAGSFSRGCVEETRGVGMTHFVCCGGGGGGGEEGVEIQATDTLFHIFRCEIHYTNLYETSISILQTLRFLFNQLADILDFWAIYVKA